MRSALLVWIFRACLMFAIPVANGSSAHAGESSALPSQHSASRIATKALSYQALSSVNDFTFGFLEVGGMAASGLLVAANVATELTTYYLHDTAWAYASSAPESATRAARTATYTGMNAVRVFGLAMLFTGSPAVSVGYAAINALVDAGVYAGNDAIWGYLWPITAPDQPQAN